MAERHQPVKEDTPARSPPGMLVAADLERGDGWQWQAVKECERIASVDILVGRVTREQRSQARFGGKCRASGAHDTRCYDRTPRDKTPALYGLAR